MSIENNINTQDTTPEGMGRLYSGLKGLEKIALERTEKLSELAVEVGPELLALNRHLQEKYSREWQEWGGEESPNIPVYFIPIAKIPEILPESATTTPDEICGAFIDAKTGAVIISFDEDNQLPIIYARLLCHELGHAYQKNQNDFKLSGEGEIMNISRIDRKMGLVICTFKGKFGSFLEEYYAVQRELEALPEIEEFLPKESRKRKETLNLALEKHQVERQDIQYLYETGDGKGITYSAFKHMHRLASRLFSKVPGGWDLLCRARVSGNWSDLLKKVDSEFGVGTFKMLMHLDPKDEVDLLSFQDFLNINNEEERRKILERTVARTKEKFKLGQTLRSVGRPKNGG